MALNLSLGGLVYSTGGALFTLIGILVLLVGWRSRRGLLVGLFALAFGLRPALQNLFLEAIPDPWYAGLNLAGTLLGIVLALHLAEDLGRRGKLRLLLCAGILTLAAIPATLELGQSSASASAALVPAAIFGLGAACGVRFADLPRESRTERRALALLAIAFGLHGFFNAVVNAGETDNLAVAYLWILASGIVVTLVWLVGTTGPDSRLARNVLFTLLGTGLVALLFYPVTHLFVVQDIGGSGIARIIGAAMLVVAITRFDLLGVPLPKLAVSKGPVAAGALATLFIVAQITENFLSAQYGLLTGGIIAGTFLFAAAPVQRAIERAGVKHKPTANSSSSRSSAQRERVYRNALRIALRDRVLSREEEIQLHELAEQMGIGAGRAMALRVEIERGEEESR